MSKVTKSHQKQAPRNSTAGPKPLTGLQKAAWWSVPMLGFVFLACGSTLGVLFAIKPQASLNQLNGNQTAAFENKTGQNAPLTDNEKDRKAEEPDSTVAVIETQNDQTVAIRDNAFVANLDEPDTSSKTTETPATPQESPAESQITPVAISSAAPNTNAVTSLVCTAGQIQFRGETKLTFVDKQPSFETIEQGGVKFEHLNFDGLEQSAELPDIDKNAGSIELVCKLPSQQTSIVLDSNFQRLTVRKNREGFRWRIDAKRKTDKIRLSPAKLDYNQWHHVMITWTDGGDAILYVNGTEQDRMAYVNEQPQFESFQKVVLGRTRGPNARFYRASVHSYKVFSQPMTSAEILAQYNQLKSVFPFIFK